MKSSRQKKRVSQQKKRHHEHVKAKGDSTGTTLAGKHVKGKEDSAGTSPSATRQERDKLSSSKDQLDAPEKGHDSKASKIPKGVDLGSNWDRYEEPEDNEPGTAYSQETEEQLQQRLIQLLNLPVHHVIPPTPSNTADTADTNSSIESLHTDSFLSLDCAMLAKSFSSLPLHQKLDINLDLVKLCEEEAEPTDESKSGPITNPSFSMDLGVCSKRKRYTFEFKPVDSSSSKTSDSAKASHHQLGSPPARDSTSNVDTRTIPLISEIVRDDEQEELDKLLEGSVSLKEGNVTRRNRHSAQTSSVVSKDITAHTPSSVVSKDITSPEVTHHKDSMKTEDTDELDDMLDELLS